MVWRHIPSDCARVLLSSIAAGTAPHTVSFRAVYYETFATGVALTDITDLVKNDPLLGQPGYVLQPQESDRCEVNGR